MNELFLICALALPSGRLSSGQESDFSLLKEYIEKRHPEYEIVFVHRDEKLLNRGVIDTGLVAVSGNGNDQRLWALRKSA